MAAMDHVCGSGRKCLWICCGRGKGEDLENFTPAVAMASEIFCFGEIAPAMADKFGPHVQIIGCNENLFAKIGEFISRHRSGWSVLFSPGFTSFDLFSNYVERGKWFDNGVGELGSKF
jgi:UDP-N-acetylmuramoylalanine--D-glutamate ligase